MIVSRLFVLTVAALCVAGATVSASAAAFPPSRSPEGAAHRMLAEGPAAAVPSALALIGVVRVTYAPGAGGEMEFGVFGDLAYVEEGELSIRIAGGATVTRPSAAGTAGLVETPGAGEEFMVEQGDAVYLHGGAGGAIRNGGEGPAVLLVGFVGVLEGDPNAGPPPSPAGVEQALLGLGMTAALPPAPASLLLERVSFPPGATLTADPDDPSLRLIAVESGSIRLRYDAVLTVGRGAPGAVEQIAAGTEVTLNPGQSALVPAFARGEARGVGDAPAEVLVVRVRPPAAAAGTAA